MTAGRIAPPERPGRQPFYLTWQPVLTAHEVAALFRVNAATVGRWARAGLLGSFFTPGGERRYRRSDVALAVRRGYQPASPLEKPPTPRTSSAARRTSS